MCKKEKEIENEKAQEINLEDLSQITGGAGKTTRPPTVTIHKYTESVKEKA